MNKLQKLFLTLLRLAMGILLFSAGFTHLSDPTFSAAGYLTATKTFPWFYHALLNPGVLPVVSVLNEWGLTLMGASLILGVGVRPSALLGAILMLLYYFPVLQFPYIAPHSFLVDEHIIYAAALLVLYAFRAGHTYGIAEYCVNWPFCRRYPKIHAWLD